MQNGNYETLRLLGHGEFGVSYLANELATNITVVIKEVPYDSQENIRLLDEAVVKIRQCCELVPEVASLLYEVLNIPAAPIESKTFAMSQNIDMQTLDGHQTSKEKKRIVRSLVIEHFVDKSLRTYIATLKKLNGQIEEQKAWDVFTKILISLHEMHSKRLIHKNLKAENIFLIEEDWYAKFSDIGFYRYPRIGETRNVLYLPPEMIQDEFD
ncbi:MAG: hypothetical protein EZS28_025337 [Streblomastix strix]|uniref:non-specific serine/threonine protein kinase n=1 Tax=Streblomastix strix TaxID=222440 RepID=A0A5J4V9G6_9EUKA|nr:MAG: hypothetical protein EZS28_025337 [Streblomastix strix]